MVLWHGMVSCLSTHCILGQEGNVSVYEAEAEPIAVFFKVFRQCAVDK